MIQFPSTMRKNVKQNDNLSSAKMFPLMQSISFFVISLMFLKDVKKVLKEKILYSASANNGFDFVINLLYFIFVENSHIYILTKIQF